MIRFAVSIKLGDFSLKNVRDKEENFYHPRRGAETVILELIAGYRPDAGKVFINELMLKTFLREK